MKKRVIISSCILFVVCIMALPYIFAFLHISYKQAEYDNSIVNAGYPDWHKVLLYDDGQQKISAKLPSEWNSEGGNIVDEKGNVVAYGQKYFIDTSGTKLEAFINNCCKDTISDLNVEVLRYQTISGGAVARYEFTLLDGSTRAALVIHFYLGDQWGYRLLFLDDSENLRDIVCAINWSMTTSEANGGQE